jgi:hypothetical protein
MGRSVGTSAGGAVAWRGLYKQTGFLRSFVNDWVAAAEPETACYHNEAGRHF